MVFGQVISVGLAFCSKFNREGPNISSGYFLYLSRTTLFSCEGVSDQMYNSEKNPVPVGTNVEVIFDEKARTIRFTIGGVAYPVAFHSVPEGEDLYGCIGYRGTLEDFSVQLVKFENI